MVPLPPTGVTTGQLAPWILWHLWLARNDFIFNNKETTPETIITRAVAAAREWIDAQNQSPEHKPTQITRKSTNNPPNTTLLQTDAAWRADLQLAGLGWCVGSGEDKVSILAHCHYVNSPLIAEGLTLREGLQYCIEKGIRQLHCESDSLLLVKALNAGQPAKELYEIIADINYLTLDFDFISFSWIQRGRNRDADALAKQALAFESLVRAPLNIVD